jgi:hypothetical protein
MNLRKIKKRGAMELSLSTIVIVVLSLTLLILGFVLVRSIMCGAIDLTKQIQGATEDQVNDLFGSTGDAVQCIGERTSIPISDGTSHEIYCRFKADQEYFYLIKTSLEVDRSDIIQKGVESSTINRDWLIVKEEQKRIGSGDETLISVSQLRIPPESPEGSIVLNIQVWRNPDRQPSSSDPIFREKQVTYEVKNSGAIRGFIC